MAPQMCRSTNRKVDPEVWFRIVHLAQDAQCGAPVAAYREQTVEIALGHKGVFEPPESSNSSEKLSSGKISWNLERSPTRLRSPPMFPHHWMFIRTD